MYDPLAGYKPGFNMRTLKHILFISLVLLLIQSCSPPEGDFAGSEYIPDMGHSIAYEANHYINYYYNTWDSASTYKLYDLSTPRKPVNGTVPRGYAGVRYAAEQKKEDVMAALTGQSSVNAIYVPVNGNVPYYYEDTEEERERAIAEIIENPFPITEDGLARGEELYNVFCGICHGEKGNGLGYLVADENTNVKYPAAPANFLLEEHVNSSNGRYYHAIMHGKNVMGGYADKLSYEERWQVIHWIRALQAKELKLEYSPTANTLKPEYGTPASDVMAMAQPGPAGGIAEPDKDAEATEETPENNTEHHDDDAGHSSSGTHSGDR